MAEARDNFDKAIGWNTENPDNYFNLGNVLLNDEKFADAHENFDTAISKDSKNAKFYHAKGLAYQAEAEYINKMENPSEETERMEEYNINLAIEQFNLAL